MCMTFHRKFDVEISTDDIIENLVNDCDDADIGHFLAELSNSLRHAKVCNNRGDNIHGKTKWDEMIKEIASVLRVDDGEDLIADVARALMDIE